MKEKRDTYRFLHVTPRRIYEQLDQYVVGQKHAKEVLAIAAYNHLKRIEYLKFGGDVSIRKSNILMIGPSGCGKTYLARTLAKILDVPFAYNDATAFTEAGYYGEDVEVAIGRLLYATNQNVESAENGIVFIDEIDKIARRSGGSRTGAGSRDIGGEGVQQGLLKLLEGREIFAPLNVTQHWNKHDFVVVDTQDILFIAAGTFSDLHLTEAAKPVGFGAELETGAPAGRRVTEKDLLDYGFIAEFLGRLPVRVELESLSEDDLYLIMTGPPDAVVREYQALLKMDGVDLRFSDEGLRAIAQYCLRRRTGARSLRTIVEEICHDVMFEAPERKGETVTVDAATVATHLDRMGGSVGSTASGK